MIEYQYKEEKDFAIHYAKELDCTVVLSILHRGFVESREEAQALSKFFWEMVGKSIEYDNQGVDHGWSEGGRFWTEKLLQTFGGHLDAAGYADVWDEEVDKH